MKYNRERFGQGKPVVCVPVMENKKEEILAEVTRLVNSGAEMIEWRVDAFEQVHCVEAVQEVLLEMKSIVESTMIVFTFRTKKQGGLLELEEDLLRRLHQIAAESTVGDFVDVEYFATEHADEEIRTLQNLGAEVIASHHDFAKTPSGKEITEILERMTESKCDIVKLAVMPQTPEDVLVLLEETNAFRRRHPNQRLITMSMGRLGVISRISGGVFGSCVTFGAGKNASAPGQIPMGDLHHILDIIDA